MMQTAESIQRDPDESEAIAAMLDARMAEMNVCMPGIIESYDATTGKADVSPVHQRVYQIDDEEQVIDQPVITNVPIMFPRGGGAAITLPLKKGDPVTLIFSQRSLDKYLETDGKQKHDSGDNRKHHISDAFAYPGGNTWRNKIDTAHADDLVLAMEDGSGEIHIKPNGEIFFKTSKVMNGTGTASIALAKGPQTEARIAALESALATLTGLLFPVIGSVIPPGIVIFVPAGAGVESTRVFTDA